MAILCLPGHAALGQDVRHLGVVGEVGPAGVGVLSVIFTENYDEKSDLKVCVCDTHLLVVVLSRVSSL